MVLKSTSRPSAFFRTTFDDLPGTKALEFALRRALVAVEGVGGGEDRPLMLFDVE